MSSFNFKNFNPRNLLVKWESLVGRIDKEKLDRLNEKTKFLRGFFDKNRDLITKVSFVFVFLSSLFYFLFLASPGKFPVGAIVEVDDGQTLSDIAENLEKNHIIKSPFVFKLMVRVIKDDKSIITGDYFFERRKNVVFVAKRMIDGNFGMEPIRVVVYEGMTIDEMSEIFDKNFDRFDTDDFKKMTHGKEGYLFPDTYFFLPSVKADDIVRAMEANFNREIAKIQDKIDTSGKSLSDIITMASIIEEEGITFLSKRMISGILWNRIKIDMPLQVDAVFPYIIGKNTYELTREDLKVDSEYNTYKYKGLPPGPIANPGLKSILAALEPIESDYLFYLSDRQGNMYYATDYEKHKRNIELYLN